jgi:large subunit ribosomal protein L35
MSQRSCAPWNFQQKISGANKQFFERSEKMPKMKTKSGAKKRFSLTATGKVKVGQSGKRHGMRKRSQRMIRCARGTTILNESDAKVIRNYFLPNG